MKTARSVGMLRIVAPIALLVTLSFSPKAVCSSSQSMAPGHCRSVFSIPDTKSAVYTNLGDINIGGYILAIPTGITNIISSKHTLAAITLEMSEAIAYAVKLVNEDPRLLPNVTLGFALVEDGYHPNVTVARTFQFLPAETYKAESDDQCECSPAYEQLEKNALSTDNNNYDVIGAISPASSYTTVPVSYVFSAAKLPLISCYSTSDGLSDKSRHPYFLRLLPPMKARVKAMLAFIHSSGWSYISVLYMGSIGETGHRSIKDLAPSHNVCLATAHKVDKNTDFDYVVRDLLKYSNARVVILLMNNKEAIALLSSINKYNSTGMFILICGEGVGVGIKGAFRGYERDIAGSFTVSREKVLISELYHHISKLRVNSTTNPWFQPSLEVLHECSFNEGSCDNNSSIAAKDFAYIKYTSSYVDAVMVFARAATELLADHCPGMVGAEARACIKGEDLLKYMVQTSFEGYSGHIAFDKNGDDEGKLNIWQARTSHKYDALDNASSSGVIVESTIAVYSIMSDTIIYTDVEILWDHLYTFPRTVRYHNKSTHNPPVPESICSKPCPLGEYIVHKESKCCWECHKCRDNERLINAGTKCEACETFTWPDPEASFASCQEITVTHSLLTEPAAVVLISTGLFTAVCYVIVTLCFIYFRHSPIIISRREIDFVQLIAVGFGSVTIVLLQLQPSDGICATIYYTFSLCLTCLYAPLLIKSLGTYRTFLGSSRCQWSLGFINRYSQVVKTVIIISFQVGILLL